MELTDEQAFIIAQALHAWAHQLAADADNHVRERRFDMADSIICQVSKILDLSRLFTKE